MKKHALFLVVLAFVFAAFNISSVSAANCGAGDLFSSVTGKPCLGEAVPQYNTSSFKELRIGSKGNDVKTIQQALKDEGYYLGKIDGNYGKRTAKSVQEFQDDNDLPVTGNVDAVTFATFNVNTTIILPSSSVVISGVSGPQSLGINKEGTWTVTAYSKYGGNLSYSVDWGDEVYRQGVANPTMAPAQQTATFSHSYLQAGNYTPKFTVTRTGGETASTSLSVNVGGVTCLNCSSITVTSPNGGETWAKGTTQTIKWMNDSGVICPTGAYCTPPVPKYYDLKLVQYNPPCDNCGAYFMEISYQIAGGVYGTSYNWVVGTRLPDPSLTFSGAIPEGTYTLQVCQTGTSICDSSDSNFKIISGTTNQSSVTVLAPNGGETWAKGTTQTIKWQDTNNISTHEIKLVPESINCIALLGVVCPQPPTYTIANTQGSSYSWLVGNSWTGVVLDGSYKIQVCQTGTSVCDSSDSYFKINSATTIQGPTIISVLPAGCSSISYYSSVNGEACTNDRTAVNLGDKVYLYGSNFSSGDSVGTYSYKDGAVVYMPTTFISSTYLSFVVPSSMETGSHSIQVKNGTNTKILNFEGATVAQCSLTATVTSTYLGTNNDWGFYVRVDAVNPPSTSSGWTTNFVGYTPQTTAYGLVKLYGNFFLSSGPLKFTPRDVVNSNCLTTIDVYPPASPSGPSVTVLSPNGGESYKVGDSIPIKFKATSFPTDSNIYLELRGSSPATKVEVVYHTNTSYTWQIPANFTPGQYKVVAYQADVNGVATNVGSDTSDAPFTISGSVGVCPAANPPLGYHYEGVQPYPTCGGYLVQDATAARNVLGASVISAMSTTELPKVANNVLDTKYNFTKYLVEGSGGPEVVALQKYLNSAGYEAGAADGIFGAKVKEAVIKLQAANKLKADGIVGFEVRTFLNK